MGELAEYFSAYWKKYNFYLCLLAWMPRRAIALLGML
jgi:hypothetical protein